MTVMFVLWCIFALLGLTWFPLLPHVSVQLNMLLLYSALQMSFTRWHKVFPLFSKDDVVEEPHFLSLAPLFPPSSSFTLTTRHVLLLHAFPSSVLLSSSPSHHLLSLSLNDLIPPMPLHLSSRVRSNFSVEVTRRVCGCNSTDSRWCQHELASCVAKWQCEIGYFLNVQCKENSSHLSGFHNAFLEISFDCNHCGKHIPLVDLKP